WKTEPDELEWLWDYKKRNIDVNLIVPKQLHYGSEFDKLSLHKLSGMLGVENCDVPNDLGVELHLEIVRNDGLVNHYIADKSLAGLSEKLIEDNDTQFYCIQRAQLISKKEFQLPKFDKSNLFEVRVKNIPRGINSNGLTDIVLNGLTVKKQYFINKIKGQRFTVDYFDKYNQSEFSMRLIAKFLKSLPQIAKIEVEEVNIYLDEKDFERNFKPPKFIIHNYQAISDYEEDLNQLKQNYDFDMKVCRKSDLPHYRYFRFQSDELSFEIRIDGGIAHGIKPDGYIESGELSFMYEENFSIWKYVEYDLIYTINLE